jgi:hypothetical protein
LHDITYFPRAIEENLLVLSQALRNNMIIPDFQAFTNQLTEIFHR